MVNKISENYKDNNPYKFKLFTKTIYKKKMIQFNVLMLSNYILI